MDIRSKFLTYKQVEAIYASNQKSVPYAVKHANNNQYIYFVGIDHAYNPDHPQFKKLRALWDEFLANTKDHDRIVLTEGGLRPVISNEEQAIEQQGEQGLATTWAHKAGIPVASPEPVNYEEARDLLNEFSKDEIMYYYFARNIPQWHKMRPRPEFKSYMQSVLNRYQQVLQWDFDFSLDNLIVAHGKLFNMPFDENNNDFFYRQSNPTMDDTIIQKVARACTIARDDHILKTIINLWREGKSIFST